MMPGVAQYQIEARTIGGVTTLAVRGELDVADAAEFRDEVQRYGAAARVGINLDLSELRFIDSSGMAALMHAREAVESMGRTIRIVNASRPVWRVFRFAGLGDLFDNDPTTA